MFFLFHCCTCPTRRSGHCDLISLRWVGCLVGELDISSQRCIGRLDGALDVLDITWTLSKGPKESYKYDLVNSLVPLIALSHDHQNHSKWPKWGHVCYTMGHSPSSHVHKVTRSTSNYIYCFDFSSIYMHNILLMCYLEKSEKLILFEG